VYTRAYYVVSPLVSIRYALEGRFERVRLSANLDLSGDGPMKRAITIDRRSRKKNALRLG